jgi:hypothetical protein
MLLPETGNRVVIRMLIRRQVPKRHVVIGGLLDAPRTRFADGIAIQQQPR